MGRGGAAFAKAFVDLQNDVTAEDLQIATREGFRSIEHVKRYTTAGMATDQGKTSNVNALATVAGLLQQPIAAVGHTTFRMPYTPVTFGTLAGAARGELLEPVRHTPLHDWAAAQGAVFEDVGTWKRARCFPRTGEIATRRRRARMPRRAQCRGSVRRQHARQDRSRWPGCRGIPRSDLYDRCRQSGRWTLPLCPDAGRERLRAGRRHHRPARTRPLPRHHHHGRRRDACCTTWRTIGRPNSPTCASG